LRFKDAAGKQPAIQAFIKGAFRMLQGAHPLTLDSKNRVVLPALLRRELPEGELDTMVLTTGRRAQWLQLWTKEAWHRRVDELYAKFDSDDEEAENYLRDVMASATQVDLDKQYRFVIPDARKKQIDVNREVVFIGMRDKIEIWAAEAYEVHRASREGKQEPPRSRGP
jgi:MraZ protein